MARAVRNSNHSPEEDERLAPERIRRKSGLVFDVMCFIRQYVVMTRPQLLAVALYVIHTHAIAAAEQTPYLSVKSPEKQCGKSRLLEVLEMLVARPWLAITPSEAVLYRKINSDRPTLLLDEIDTIFNTRNTSDRFEPHRALLNAGHRRGTKVPRMIGTASVAEFDVFCAKVLAGIGALPDTVADRSIPITLKRKLQTESVERFRKRKVEPVAKELREKVEKWANPQRTEELQGAQPLLPEELSDRMQEGCEPLLAIADALKIGDEARIALVAVCTEKRLDDLSSMRLRLLQDIRSVFEERDARKGRRVKGIPTTALIEALCAMDEAPWATYFGRSLSPRDVATLLKHYDVESKSIRFKSGVAKGYKRDHLHDVWERYLP